MRFIKWNGFQALIFPSLPIVNVSASMSRMDWSRRAHRREDVPAAQRAQTTPAHGPAMYPATLHLVEDQAAVLAHLDDRLARNGWACGVAASGREALTLVHGHRTGLTLLDFRIQEEMGAIRAAEIVGRGMDAQRVQHAEFAAPYGLVMKPSAERELRLNIDVTLHKHEGEFRLAVALDRESNGDHTVK